MKSVRAEAAHQSFTVPEGSSRKAWAENVVLTGSPVLKSENTTRCSDSETNVSKNT